MAVTRDLPQEAIGPLGSIVFRGGSIPVFVRTSVATCIFPRGGSRYGPLVPTSGSAHDILLSQEIFFSRWIYNSMKDHYFLWHINYMVCLFGISLVSVIYLLKIFF